MDLLTKTGAVKLRSHLEKYLVADQDREAVRQSRNGSSIRAVWVVEPAPGSSDAVRLRNLGTGLYLTTSDTPYLLGMTGNRVVQLSIFDPARVEWEPVNDGFQVKFRAHGEGTYLRGNGGTPPWRNSVTHDKPLTGGTYNWILWDVEPVLLSDLKDIKNAPSPLSSFNSVFSDDNDGSFPPSPYSGKSITASPYSVRSISSPRASSKQSGMDLFRNAKAVRLKSRHDKYLLAVEDEETVTQDRNGSSRNAKWYVEFVENGAVRLRSCYNKYLTASNQPFLLGMTGRKVLQTLPRRLDSSLEWEPEKVGSQVRLKTRYGNYLRANGGLPPWRNSVTHDVPHRTVTQDWVLWDVHVVDILEHSDEIYSQKPEKVGSGLGQVKVAHVDSFGSDSSSVTTTGSDRFQRQESNESGTYSPPKPDSRLIRYDVADEFGNIDESEENTFSFKGHNMAELTRKLEEETGLEEIYVCTRSIINGKLYPLRLQLPPNNAAMHIVVVPSTSRLAQDFVHT